MFTQRQTYMEKALLSAVAVLLLLTTSAQTAATTAAPDLSNSSLTTQLNNSSMEEPLVLRSHRSCRSEHENYCNNGGECMYPQDSDKPSCICTSSYSGPRCLFYNPKVSSCSAGAVDLGKVFSISFGVVGFLIVLTIVMSCCVCKRCKKSAEETKSAPSYTPVTV